MHGLTRQMCKTVAVILMSFSLASCSALNLFNSSDKDTVDGPPDNARLETMESEIHALRQEQADLKFSMEKKEQTIQELESRLLTMKKKIAQLEKKQVQPKPVQYKVEYSSPPVLYKKARNLLIEENFTTAAGLFETFIKNHPDDSLADNAVYWLGECHYTLGEYKRAISAFKGLETRYPKSEKVPDAILKLGYSYLSLDDTNRAHHYLKKVLKKYPFSPAAEKAEVKLRSFE